MSEDLQLAISAAKEAGEIIREGYGKSKKILRKEGNDFATETDIQAEKLIIDILQKTGYSFLGEETGSTDHSSNKRWIIDPLDGTMNFVRGVPFFAVSIGLLEDEKDLILGVVYDPILDECYWAEKGEGAYMNDKKIAVSTVEDLDKAAFAIDHGKTEENKSEYLKSLNAVMRNNGAITLRQGATALMLCYVAKGSFESFLSCGDELFDYAAGLVIAQEAGAIVSDWHGDAWNTESSSIVVANAAMHEKICERIAEI